MPTSDDTRSAPPSAGAILTPDTPPTNASPASGVPPASGAPERAATRAVADTRVKLTELTPQAVDRIRDEYIDGEPVLAIRSKFNVSNATFYACLNGVIPGRPRLPLIPRRKVRLATAPESDIRSLLIGKLWRTAKRQVSDVEARLRSANLAPSERESENRMLAVLVKTIRDLKAMDDTQDGARQPNAADARNDDPIPRDIDEFRRELARRMDAFVGTGEVPGIPGESKP